MKHREYMGEMDALTNVMGRRLFLNYCTKCQNDIDNKSKRKGWFLFIDIDWFKQINGTLGHTVGDETLKQVAESLKSIFSSYGAVGRVGSQKELLTRTDDALYKVKEKGRACYVILDE